jgi:hypothetical protein
VRIYQSKVKQAELETNAVYAEKFPPKPKAQKVDCAEVDTTIAAYLNDCAITLKPSSVSGKQHNMNERRKICTKTYMDELLIFLPIWSETPRWRLTAQAASA